MILFTQAPLHSQQVDQVGYKERVAPSRINLRKRGPMQKLGMYRHDQDRHKGNGNLNLLYQELNEKYEQIIHLLIKLIQLREL